MDSEDAHNALLEAKRLPLMDESGHVSPSVEDHCLSARKSFEEESTHHVPHTTAVLTKPQHRKSTTPQHRKTTHQIPQIGEECSARSIFGKLHDTGGYNVPDGRGHLHAVTFKNEHGVHEAVARGAHMAYSGVNDHWAFQDHQKFEREFLGGSAADVGTTSLMGRVQLHLGLSSADVGTSSGDRHQESEEIFNNEELSMDEFMVFLEQQQRQLKDWEEKYGQVSARGDPGSEVMKKLLQQQSMALTRASMCALRSTPRPRSQSPTKDLRQRPFDHVENRPANPSTSLKNFAKPWKEREVDTRGLQCRSSSAERWKRTRLRAWEAQREVKPAVLIKNKTLRGFSSSQGSRWERLAVEALGREDLLKQFDQAESGGYEFQRGQLVTQAVVEEFTNLQGDYRKADIYWEKAMNELAHTMPGAAEVAKGAQGIHSMMTHEQMIQMLPFDALEQHKDTPEDTQHATKKKRSAMVTQNHDPRGFDELQNLHPALRGQVGHTSDDQAQHEPASPRKSVRAKSPAERALTLHRKSLASFGRASASHGSTRSSASSPRRSMMPCQRSSVQVPAFSDRRASQQQESRKLDQRASAVQSFSDHIEDMMNQIAAGHGPSTQPQQQQQFKKFNGAGSMSSSHTRTPTSSMMSPTSSDLWSSRSSAPMSHMSNSNRSPRF